MAASTDPQPEFSRLVPVDRQLAVALDPYPRAPGAVLPEEPRTAEGPFAALESLKRGR